MHTRLARDAQVVPLRGCSFWTRCGPNAILTLNIGHRRALFINLTLKACDRLAMGLLAFPRTGGKVLYREIIVGPHRLW